MQAIGKPELASSATSITEHVQRKSAAKRYFSEVQPLASSSRQGAGRFRCWHPELFETWLTAGRTLDGDLLDSDRIAFTLRLGLLANYGSCHILVAIAGILYFTVVSPNHESEKIVCIVHSASAISILVGVHLVNRGRFVTLRSSIAACTFLLILLNLLGAPLFLSIVQCSAGWHWSCGIIISMVGAPIGTIVLTTREGLDLAVTVATLALISAVMVTFTLIRPVLGWGGKEFFYSLTLAIMTNYGLVPALVAIMFRWECREHQSRLQAQVETHKKLTATRATVQWLIFSLMPPSKVQQLPAVSPELWHTAVADDYQDCTILQMDVSGFTALSAFIPSADVVQIVQALFVSIDYAAECIGNVWKVELIGDCYKAIIGGPHPCRDHARRGVALAYSIVSICRAVSRQLQVRLSVRVGLHTGSVTAAVVGVRMPRYLMFGRAAEIVGKLEAAAARDSVLLSESTAAALQGEWPHTEETEVSLTDGLKIKGFASSEHSGAADLREILAKLATWLPDSDLAPFLRDFCGAQVVETADSAMPAPCPVPDSAGLGEAATGSDLPTQLRPSALRSRIQNFSTSTLNLQQRRVSHADVELRPRRRSLADVAELRYAVESAGRYAVQETAQGWERIYSDGTEYSQSELSVAGILDPQENGDGLLAPDVLPSELVQYGTTKMATSLTFQRTLTRLYLIASAVTGLLHCLLLLALMVGRGGSRQWQPSVLDNEVVLPGLVLCASLLLLLGSSHASWDWASRRPQTAATLLLFLSAVAFEGTSRGEHLTRWSTLPWGFLGVMVQASCSDLASRRWQLWLLVYIGFGVGMIGWVHADGQGLEGPRDVEWWRELLMGWNFIVTVALFLVPLALSARGVLHLQQGGRKLLWATKRHARMEDKLLDALAPSALSRRFVDGDKLVVTGIEEGTVMFAYVVGYEEVDLCHGAGETIAWVNKVFKQLDMCIDKTGSVTKVETFNNFLLVFCADPKLQVQVCLELAIRMLNAVERIVRPDGKPTVLKIGMNSGPFTAGIIGLQSPKYSIFGDTINTASRMASTSLPSSSANPFIHISPLSQALYHKGGNSAEVIQGLGGSRKELSLSRRDEPIQVKGKGLMQTFCLSPPPPEPSVWYRTSAQLT